MQGQAMVKMHPVCFLPRKPVSGVFAVGPMRAGHEMVRGHLGPPAFSVPVLKTQIPETMKHVLKL